MDDREGEQVNDLIGDSRYFPFFHRVKESNFSLFVKWIANFVLAVIEFINLPAFVFLALIFLQQVVIAFGGALNLPISIYKFIAVLFGGWLLLRFLFEKTRKNITSPTVLPVWFMNSKGVFKNLFFSVETAQKYNTDLQAYVSSQANEYIRQKIKVTEEINAKLLDLVDRMSELNDFPNETYESLGRTIGFVADAALQPRNPRHQFQNVMDRIMNEIATTKPIQPYIKSGSIMMLGDDHMLRLVGQLYLPNSTLNKEIKLGARFSGKVLREGKWVWVPDVNTDESRNMYDFRYDPNRTYKGIFGFPFYSGVHDGVICLHFTDVDWQGAETKVIAKTLEVYSHIIVAAFKLRNITRDGK